MQKTNLLVTASAICFAMVGATLGEHQSQSSALTYYAGRTTTGQCVQAEGPLEEDCSILNITGVPCTVFVVDSWGTPQQVAAYQSPLLNNLCLLALKRF